MAVPTHYEILGIPTTADQESIRAAYRQLAFDLHPDRNPETARSELFLMIQEAYDTLSDEERKKDYDLSLGILAQVSGPREPERVQPMLRRDFFRSAFVFSGGILALLFVQAGDPDYPHLYTALVVWVGLLVGGAMGATLSSWLRLGARESIGVCGFIGFSAGLIPLSGSSEFSWIAHLGQAILAASFATFFCSKQLGPPMPKLLWDRIWSTGPGWAVRPLVSILISGVGYLLLTQSPIFSDMVVAVPYGETGASGSMLWICVGGAFAGTLLEELLSVARR